MTFWDNVAIELDYLGMTEKYLSEKVGIAASGITKGKRLGSCPAADTAVKIAKILGVSVEYLVSGIKSNSGDINNSITIEQVRKSKKYSKLIDNFETLPDYEQEGIMELINKLSSVHK